MTGVTVLLCVRLGCYAQQPNGEILCEGEEISLPDISMSASEQRLPFTIVGIAWNLS